MQRLHAFWWARQGLAKQGAGSTRGLAAAKVLERTGWSRSVGGAGPYLALFARAGVSRAAVDADVAALRIHELPSARGCTYVVPAGDFGLALRASRGHGDAAEIATAKKHLGVTDKEIDGLCQAVTDALARAPMDPRALKEALGGAVRNLGAEGKKRGTTTTLPLALGRLQTEGAIRRVPQKGRLDQQRYAYTVWEPRPRCTLSDEELAVELGRRFFRWAGPATAAELAWWAGLGAKAAKAVVAALGLVPLAASDPRVLFPDDREALGALRPGKAPEYALVGSLDNISHLRRDVVGLLDPERSALRLPGGKSKQAGGALQDLPHHAILDRGTLVGFWEYDAAAGRIAWMVAGKASPALREEVARVETFVKGDLGDARSFSLDSPESRGERIAALRRLAA